MSDTVFKRHIVHLGGYDPMSPETYHRRFQRELGRFHSTWNIRATVSPLVTTDHDARWQVVTEGAGWKSVSEHIMLRWDDVIEKDRARNWFTRLPLGVLCFADFIWHGALWGYLRLAWRYAGFFLYPFMMLMALAGIALFASHAVFAMFARTTGLDPWPFITQILGMFVFAGLLHWPGRRLFLDHLVDDWIYASQLLRHGDAVVSGRVEKLAQELTHHSKEAGELLIIGHSLGAVHAVELIDRLVALAQEGPPIRLASVGSSILKIGLHRSAERLRQGMVRISASSRVIWTEFHALNDVMNFYKCEPMAALGLTGHGLAGKPAITRVVRFRAMLEPEYYRRMERNFFRLHCQFVSGNDRRAAYDYFMMLLGPFPMEQLALSNEGAVPWVDDAGGLTQAAIPHLSQQS